MNIEQWSDFLGWSALLNYFLLTTWFLLFVIAKEWLFELHSAWFDISRTHFNVLHYSGIAFYKILLFVFNLMPYLAIRIML
jgi:hypothetical protein